MDEFEEFARQFFENERLVDEMPKNICIPMGEPMGISQYDPDFAYDYRYRGLKDVED